MLFNLQNAAIPFIDQVRLDYKKKLNIVKKMPSHIKVKKVQIRDILKREKNKGHFCIL